MFNDSKRFTDHELFVTTGIVIHRDTSTLKGWERDTLRFGHNLDRRKEVRAGISEGHAMDVIDAYQAGYENGLEDGRESVKKDFRDLLNVDKSE